MFDLVKLHLAAGDGGNGKVSFHRQKFITKGGPDGGNGGRGGNIYIQASKHINTLQHFSGVKEYLAQRGQDGGKDHQIGFKGDDVILEVPVGTTVWLLAENKASFRRRMHISREGHTKLPIYLKKYYLDKPSGNPPFRDPDDVRLVTEEDEALALEAEIAREEATYKAHAALADRSDTSESDDLPEEEELILRSSSLKNLDMHSVKKLKVVDLLEDGQRVLICQGGEGGRGNDNFKSSKNTTPFEAEYGSFGEQKIILLELKLLADIGLIGYPNAGKSTLLSIVTKANPKIANYPFTTLEPNLGVMAGPDKNMRDIVIADIPGIIEGANEGKGLGFSFLRHVQACKVLMFLLTLEENQIFDAEVSDMDKATALFQQFQTLTKELEAFDPELLKKPFVVSISKADLYSAGLCQEIKKLFAKHKQHVIFFSAMTQQGIDEMKESLLKLLNKAE